MHAKTLIAPLVLAFAGLPRGYAQADYRNLDPGRPIAVEDAQPIEFRAFEIQFGVPRFSRETGGESVAGFEQEVKWGVRRDTQLGVATQFVRTPRVGSLQGEQLHLLYNFNQESRRLPAIALRPELSVRGGALGSQHQHGGLKLIASKTVRRNRLHFNGSYALGPTEASGRGGDLVSRYFYGAAYERTFPLKFLVLLADVYARKPIDHAITEAVFDIGTRVQLTPVWVLDAGISRRLRQSAGPVIGFTFGLNYTFSFRSLFPRAA